MNREEILKQAQEENKKVDYAYAEIEKNGAKLAYSVGAMLAVIMFTIENLMNGIKNPAYILLSSTPLLVAYVYQYIKSKRKYNLVFSIITGIITIIFAIVYIKTTFFN